MYNYPHYSGLWPLKTLTFGTAATIVCSILILRRNAITPWTKLKSYAVARIDLTCIFTKLSVFSYKDLTCIFTTHVYPRIFTTRARGRAQSTSIWLFVAYSRWNKMSYRVLILRKKNIIHLLKSPVWYSSQQLHELLWAVFFCQTLIFKTASWVKLFFPSSHKDISWDETENK